MIQTETIIYSSPLGKDLKMDVYRPQQEGPLPVVISIPNGNFLNGRRNEAVYRYTCEYFAQKGFLSIAIDYRQGLQHTAFLPHTILQAIRMGVEDLEAATSYILNHAEALNADPTKIIMLGNGAGACIALTTEYELRGGRLIRLPEGFNYSCIVAHSGAMATDEREFQWTAQPCPIVLVQGEPAGDIPSGRFFVPGLLWVGGEALHHELTKAGCRNIYYDVNGLEHRAMTGTKVAADNITEYLDQFVMKDIELLTR